MRHSQLPLGVTSRVDALTTVAPVDAWDILGEIATARTTPTLTVRVCRRKRDRASLIIINQGKYIHVCTCTADVSESATFLDHMIAYMHVNECHGIHVLTMYDPEYRRCGYTCTSTRGHSVD